MKNISSSIMFNRSTREREVLPPPSITLESLRCFLWCFESAWLPPQYVILKDVNVGHPQLKIQNTKPVLPCDCHRAIGRRVSLHHWRGYFSSLTIFLIWKIPHLLHSCTKFCAWMTFRLRAIHIFPFFPLQAPQPLNFYGQKKKKSHLEEKHPDHKGFCCNSSAFAFTSPSPYQLALQWRWQW